VLNRIRRSLALKLILASAIPSAVVLLAGESALVAHSQKLFSLSPTLAFEELRSGVVLGTLLAMTFAGMTIALTARHFLVKPIQSLQQVMARAELGEFLVRAKVASSDELGSLARSFNTMLSRVTDMAIADLEARDSLEQMQRELNLQEELKQAKLKKAEDDKLAKIEAKKQADKKLAEQKLKDEKDQADKDKKEEKKN